MLLAVAAIGYIALIAFIRFHPVGRDLSMLDFNTNPQIAVITSLWILAISASYLYAKREQSGGKTIRAGCLGILLAWAASMIAVCVGVTPASWTQLQSEIFIRNLVTLSPTPFGVVWIAGLLRLRVAEAKSGRQSR